MKVIVAGMPKTGTKSMNAALKKLGYSVYDFAENAFLLGDYYNKIAFEGWTTQDFRDMYEDVDAVVDFPAHFFWEEIHKAFPDAKIILTKRNSEEEWLQSLEKQVAMNEGLILFKLMPWLSPTSRKSLGAMVLLGQVAFGGTSKSILGSKTNFNKQMVVKRYRQHNAYVLHTAPKDKLLVYNVSEGWDSLCEFLGVPVPQEPFPHKNKGGNIVNSITTDFPVFRQIQREIIVSSIVLSSSAVLTGFVLYKYGVSGILGKASDCWDILTTKIGLS